MKHQRPQGRCTPGSKYSRVMPGLVPGIHVLIAAHSKDVDGRDKPGHDESISKIRWYNARFAGVAQHEA